LVPRGSQAEQAELVGSQVVRHLACTFPVIATIARDPQFGLQFRADEGYGHQGVVLIEFG